MILEVILFSHWGHHILCCFVPLGLLLVIRHFLTEHAAGQDILGFNGHQIGPQDSPTFGKETVGLAQARPVYYIAHAASIGEAGHEHTPLEIFCKRLERLWTETIHLLREHYVWPTSHQKNCLSSAEEHPGQNFVQR